MDESTVVQADDAHMRPGTRLLDSRQTKNTAHRFSVRKNIIY